MHIFAICRRLAPVAMISLLAVACSSSSVDTEAALTAGADPATSAPASGSAVNPANIEQLGLSLTGSDMTADNISCILGRAEGDSTLTDSLTGIDQPGYQFNDETFTALAVAMHACVDPEVLAASLLALSGADDDESRSAFSTCIQDRIGQTPDGDLAYTGLAAINVGFPVPGGSTESTIDAARGCVSAQSLANQLASTTEQGSGFELEVDRECLAGELTPDFLDMFWAAAVNNEAENAELQNALEGCSAEYESGLPTEVPADFEAWSGEGELAGIDPRSRNGVYAEAPPMTLEEGADYRALIETSDGTMTIDLFEDTAPITVNSFVNLARDGYYDGTRFHRVIDGFMAQAGDPSGTGSGSPGFSFADEESGLTPVDRRGLLAMANSGPDTNGSQFFITFDAATHLDGLHVVFGEIIDGDDVLAQIDLRDPQAPTSRGEELVKVTIEVQ